MKDLSNRPVESNSQIKAVLGPTNTGKTHLAVERMLGHASGMIGLPLRLLAREIYDRVVKSRGVSNVALITGEEKIVPKNARFYVCTVESMPIEKPVEFLAIDEVQLAADFDRGHVFYRSPSKGARASGDNVFGFRNYSPTLFNASYQM